MFCNSPNIFIGKKFSILRQCSFLFGQPDQGSLHSTMGPPNESNPQALDISGSNTSDPLINDEGSRGWMWYNLEGSYIVEGDVDHPSDSFKFDEHVHIHTHQGVFIDMYESDFNFY